MLDCGIQKTLFFQKYLLIVILSFWNLDAEQAELALDFGKRGTKNLLQLIFQNQ